MHTLKNKNISYKITNQRIGNGSSSRAHKIQKKYKLTNFTVIEGEILPEKTGFLIYDKFINLKLFNNALRKNIIQYLITHPIFLEDFNRKSIKQILRHINKIFLPFPRSKYLKELFYPYDIKFLGLLAAKPSIEEIEAKREQYKIGKETIIVTAGGGGWSEAQNVYKYAMDNFRKENKIFVYGKFYQGEKIGGENIIEVQEEENLPALLANASLIICQGGLNTLSEIASLGRPALCFPVSVKKSGEYFNAEFFSAKYKNIKIGK